MQLKSNDGTGEIEITTDDGDRINLDIFVIQLFELLQICLNNRPQESETERSGPIASNDMSNLLRVLARYMQLSSEQFQQAYFSGNEFLSSEEDDTLELSLRHTGKIFLKNLCHTSFRELFDSLFHLLETDLTEFSQMYGSSSNQLFSLQIPMDVVVKIEALVFILSAVSRPIVKRYLKSMKGDMSVNSSPSPFMQKRHSHSSTDSDLTENDVLRLCQAINLLVALFYQTPLSEQITSNEIHIFSSFSILRGAISKVLTNYCPVLVKSISLQPLISQSHQFSLLPVPVPESRSITLVESLSAKLLHCRSFGEMMRVSAKNYGCIAVLGNEIQIENLLASCVQLCPMCNEFTIHIPLEIIESLLQLVVQYMELEFQTAISLENGTFTPSKLLSPETIINATQIGLTVWSIYCFDPFVLEISKDMLSGVIQVSSFRNDYLSIFLDQFVPPTEHLIGEIASNQANKTIADASIKVLVDTASRISALSSYGVEANHRISLPALQCIIRVMHFSTDVDGVIDPGETLRALVTLLSARYFSSESLPVELVEELVTETLFCIRMIFSKIMDYNYPAAIGALFQLINHFSGNSLSTQYPEYIQQTVHIILNSNKSDNHRNILIMGLIHIFNKQPNLIVRSLGHVQLENSNQTALQYLLEVWFELHPLLESPYNLHVSTNGLVELIQLYSSQGISSGFLVRTLRLMLETLPGVLRNESTQLDENEDEQESLDGFSSDGDYFLSDEEENGDDAEGDLLTGNEDIEEGDSPFAPAELYLSDLIDINGGRSYGSSHVYIPNDLAFAPFKQDPVFHTKISAKLAVIIANAEQQSSGILLSSLQSLHINEQQLLRSLLAD